MLPISKYDGTAHALYLISALRANDMDVVKTCETICQNKDNNLFTLQSLHEFKSVLDKATSAGLTLDDVYDQLIELGPELEMEILAEEDYDEGY